MNLDFQKPNSLIPDCLRSLILLILTMVIFLPFFPSAIASEKNVVRAVVFYKNDCQDCRKVLNSTLTLFEKKYGDQISILAVNNSTSKGGFLYLNAIMKMEIPHTHEFPILIFGNRFLDGAEKIAAGFPEIIKNNIDKDGIDWPVITGLKEVQEEADKNPQENGNRWVKADSSSWMTTLLLGFRTKFNQDPEGNLIAVVLLIIMIFSVIGIAFVFSRTPSINPIMPPTWIISFLSIIGLAIASYFIYVGITNTDVFCGPVGDCNTVQQSSFAYLFGIIPISIPGFLSYLTILICCFVKKQVSGNVQNYLAILIWGISLWGVLFFIYLTFLEPFIIGASCAWCLSAATVMTLIMIASTNPARISWWKLRE